jgi:hypothetical protein
MDLTSVTGLFLHMSFDWLLLIGAGLLAFLDSMRGGSARAVALSLSLPLTYLLMALAPKAQLVAGMQGQLSSSLAQALFAAAVLFVCFLLLYRMTDTFVSEGGFLQSLAGALGLAALLGLFWALIPGFAAVYEPSAQMQGIFAEPYRFWWLLAALAALAFSRS